MQRQIVDQIRKKGGASLFEITTWAFVNDLLDGRKRDSAGTDERYASQIKNVSSIYRMMRSLEKHGFVTRVLHTRAYWVPVEWEGNRPMMKEINIPVSVRPPVEYRTRDVIYS